MTASQPTSAGGRQPTGAPFGEGYNDGLWNRESRADGYLPGRPRDKYLEGYAYGVQDREDGALQPVEKLS